jgi:hypothetical protein
MLRHAVINKEGKVVNVVIWDGKTKWQAPEGCITVQNDQVNIGDDYDYEKKEITHNFTASPDPIIEEKPQLSIEDLQRQLDELKSKLNM